MLACLAGAYGPDGQYSSEVQQRPQDLRRTASSRCVRAGVNKASNGYCAEFGTKRSQVQILSPRPVFYLISASFGKINLVPCPNRALAARFCGAAAHPALGSWTHAKPAYATHARRFGASDSEPQLCSTRAKISVLLLAMSRPEIE